MAFLPYAGPRAPKPCSVPLCGSGLEPRGSNLNVCVKNAMHLLSIDTLGAAAQVFQGIRRDARVGDLRHGLARQEGQLHRAVQQEG